VFCRLVFFPFEIGSAVDAVRSSPSLITVDTPQVLAYRAQYLNCPATWSDQSGPYHGDSSSCSAFLPPAFSSRASIDLSVAFVPIEPYVITVTGKASDVNRSLVAYAASPLVLCLPGAA
jgi:hypothetical protein